MLTANGTIVNASTRVANLIVIVATILIGSLQIDKYGIHAMEVLALMRNDKIRLLKPVAFSMLMVKKRLQRQTLEILRNDRFTKVFRPQDSSRFTIFQGFPLEDLLSEDMLARGEIQKLRRGKDLLLGDCSSLFQAHVLSVLAL